MLERKDILDRLIHSTDFREKITNTMYQTNVQYRVPGYFACGYILVQSSFILCHATILKDDCTEYIDWSLRLEFEKLTLEKLKECMDITVCKVKERISLLKQAALAEDFK